jgi:hypothetical protein
VARQWDAEARSRHWDAEARFGSRTSFITIAAAAIAVIVAVVAAAQHQRPSALSHADVSEPFPATTAQDWTTYADHVVEATVTSKAPRGRTGVSVTTLSIGEVMWSRPHAPPAPATMIVSTTPIEGTPQLEPGHTYLMAIRQFTGDASAYRGVDGWGPLSVAAIFPYDDGRIGNGEQVAGRPWPSELRRATEGGSARDLVEALSGR